MIAFDVGLLSIDVVQLKTVTTSLGGSITVVDEKKSTTDKQVFKRVAVPMAVARDFIQKTKKITRYLKPVLTAIVRYDNHVIAMERHPLSSLGTLESEGFDGKIRRWVPQCETNIEHFIEPLTYRNDRDWYFDGRYMYCFDTKDLKTVIDNGTLMSSDKHFVKVNASTIDFQSIGASKDIKQEQRSCIAFVTSSGDFVISPPIWKDLSSIGTSQLTKANAKDDESVSTVSTVQYPFDKIDENLSVNLNFALKAGNEVGRVFGYESVEPLHLPRLMVELHTVNLPGIPNAVKSTYDIGLSFTHALAWLLGMTRRANNLETYLMMRSLLKFLTKRGIFRNNAFEAAHVFKDNKTVSDVPLKKIDELTGDEKFTQSLWSKVFEQILTITKRTTSEVKTVGSLQIED